MGRAYSLDLRERVVAAVEKEACHAVRRRRDLAWVAAQRCGYSAFGDGQRRPGRSVAISRRRYRGSIATGWCNGAGTADFTLRGLVAELAERGLKVDYRSVWNFVHAEKLSYKKRR